MGKRSVSKPDKAYNIRFLRKAESLAVFRGRRVLHKKLFLTVQLTGETKEWFRKKKKNTKQ